MSAAQNASATNPSGSGNSFRSRAAEWLFQQGVSTVLLGFIAVGAWFGIPAAVHELRDVLDKTGKRHEHEVKGLSDTFERTLDRLQGKVPKAAELPAPPAPDDEARFDGWPAGLCAPRSNDF